MIEPAPVPDEWYQVYAHEKRPFGKFWCGPDSLPADTPTLVAKYPAEGDGLAAEVWVSAAPSRFYTLKVLDGTNSVGTPRQGWNTGSSEEVLISIMAEAVARGRLAPADILSRSLPSTQSLVLFQVDNAVLKTVRMEHDAALDTPEALMEAFKTAVLEWICATDEGQAALAKHGQLNIGDLEDYHYQAALREFMRNNGIHEWTDLQEQFQQVVFVAHDNDLHND